MDSALGSIENTIYCNSCHDLIIVGDTNFPCSLSNPSFKQFNQFLTDFKLVHCDNFISIPDKNTYVNDALGHFSCRDNVFVINALLLNLKKISIIYSGVNHSDHKHICGFFDITLELNIAKSGNNSLMAGYNSYSLRWDKSNLNDYSNVSRDLLSNSIFDTNLSHCDHNCKSCLHVDIINDYYRRMVHALINA